MDRVQRRDFPIAARATPNREATPPAGNLAYVDRPSQQLRSHAPISGNHCATGFQENSR